MTSGTQFRAFRLDRQEFDETKPGHVIFHSSVFGVPDSYGTIFDKGCFAQTIKQHDGLFPVLWFHNPRVPIALGLHEEDDTGLCVAADLDLEVEAARNVYSGLRQGYVDCASVAFRVVTEALEDEITHFKEVRLWESSLLTKNFAAQAEATVDSVRALPDAIERVNIAAREMGREEFGVALESLRELLDDLNLTLDPPADGRPYPNEHACRLKAPGGYKTFRRVPRKHEGKTYYVIRGQQKADTSKWDDQAFRYPKATWSVDSARAHCKGHDGKTFEPAGGETAAACALTSLEVPSSAAVTELNARLGELTSDVQGMVAALAALTPKAPQGTLADSKARIAADQGTLAGLVEELRALVVEIN